jgi:TrmH family RNA methyltransferase
MPTSVRFVLMHPRTPENLGAAARALKNFGQSEWTWVPPWSPDDPRARKLAVGAEDVLASARFAPGLDEAVADCSWVVGTSGRARLHAPPIDPETLAAEAARRPGRVALVFGDERTGLLRDELARCHTLIRILSDRASPRST